MIFNENITILFWVLVFSFMYLVSVYPTNRTIEVKKVKSSMFLFWTIQRKQLTVIYLKKTRFYG